MTTPATPLEQLLGALAHLEVAFAERVAGVLLRGSRAVQLGGAMGRNPLATGSGRLSGFSVRETAGAAATVILRDGTDATGPEIVSITLVANQSIRDQLPDVFFANGLYADVVAGAVLGAVYIGGTD